MYIYPLVKSSVCLHPVQIFLSFGILQLYCIAVLVL